MILVFILIFSTVLVKEFIPIILISTDLFIFNTDLLGKIIFWDSSLFKYSSSYIFFILKLYRLMFLKKWNIENIDNNDYVKRFINIDNQWTELMDLIKFLEKNKNYFELDYYIVLENWLSRYGNDLLDQEDILNFHRYGIPLPTRICLDENSKKELLLNLWNISYNFNKY
jgi:hypothetical protein